VSMLSATLNRPESTATRTAASVATHGASTGSVGTGT